MVFGIPLFINYLFKNTCNVKFIVAEWSAGDALNFYGTLLSFLGAVYLGYAALELNKKSNDISDRLYMLEKSEQEYENRPFVMISNFNASIEIIRDIVLKPKKIYIDIGLSDDENMFKDNALCLSVFFTNTSYSFTIVEFSNAEVYDGDRKIGRWINSVSNQSNPKLYLNSGEVGEIVFYNTIDKMKSYDSKEIIINLILQNKFGKHYKEIILISPMILSQQNDDNWYVHLNAQDYQITSTNYVN